MKIFNSILTVIALGAVLTLAGCDMLQPPPPEPTGAEKNEELLKGGAWDLTSVTVNGVDRTSVYEGLTVSFSSSGFTATNGGAIWPSNGTWSFNNDEGVTMTRNDGAEISITEISETRLVLAMLWDKTTLGSGREKSVEGQHVLTFGR
jgi:hypothetical protein